MGRGLGFFVFGVACGFVLSSLARRVSEESAEREKQSTEDKINSQLSSLENQFKAVAK